MIPLCRTTGRKLAIANGLDVVPIIALYERADRACRGKSLDFRDRVMQAWRQWLWN